MYIQCDNVGCKACDSIRFARHFDVKSILKVGRDGDDDDDDDDGRYGGGVGDGWGRGERWSRRRRRDGDGETDDGGRGGRRDANDDDGFW